VTDIVEVVDERRYASIAPELLAHEDQREQELNTAFMVLEAYYGNVIKRLKQVCNDAVQRCHNPKTTSYRWYGAKGVEVCHEWRADTSTFVQYVLENFAKTFWLKSGKGNKRYFHIDRIDPSKGYEPGNIQFTPSAGNCSRRRRAGPHRNLTKADIEAIVKLKEDGLSQGEIAERFDVSRQVVSYHLRASQVRSA
jgi:DNA-binding CsgD family transcriptional regulator